MFKEKMRRKIAVLLIAMMAFTSFGVAFAEGEEKEDTTTAKLQGIFQDAYDDEDVQDATIEMSKPMANLVSIFFAGFGLVLVAGVFYFGGKDFWATLAGEGSMSKGRCGVLIFGLALGALFFTGGVFDTIGLTDRIVVKALQKLLNN